MSEWTIETAGVTDVRARNALVLAAAARSATAIDAVTGAVYVLRYGEIERLLNDPRLHGVGLSMFDHMGIASGPLRDWYGSLMFTNDGPRHDRLRRLVSKAFTPRAVDRLRPIAAAEIARRVARVRARGDGDLVATFDGVPMHAMCSLLGVPPGAVPEFVAWVSALSPIFGFMEPEQIAAATGAIGELLRYVEKLVEQRSHAPADDLITSLLRAEDAGDRLTRDETVTMVANLLVGGHDTTASQIACTLLALLDRPAALAELRGEPALLPSLVAETLRFQPGITAAPRTVVQPLEIGGVARPAGTMVMLSFLSAHRDAAVWRDADAFEPRRFADPSAPRLLAFGGGPHYCLGAALARMTIEEVVRAIAELAPKLTADPESIEWVQVLGVAPARLPVAL